MATEKESGGGIGFFGMLTIVFIVLKLTGFIDWSWWWITAPIWGGVVLWVATIILLFAGFGLVGVYNRARRKMGRRNRNG
jgi:hypothetical protein